MSVLKKCIHCGKENTKIYSDGCCQTCHLYVKRGGIFHPLPNKGEVKLDDRGMYICHICGTAHDKLGEHVRRKHKILIASYRKQFEIKSTQRLTSDEYHDKMKEHNLKNDAIGYLKK